MEPYAQVPGEEYWVRVLEDDWRTEFVGPGWQMRRYAARGEVGVVKTEWRDGSVQASVRPGRDWLFLLPGKFERV
jgi:hypothetical protein